jgi:hypothetical protein
MWQHRPRPYVTRQEECSVCYFYSYSTWDIDESSAMGLRDAASYAKANAMLIQVPVLGTAKTFWRLSDDATRSAENLH